MTNDETQLRRKTTYSDPAQTAAAQRDTRYKKIADHALTLPTVQKQLSKPRPSPVYLQCQGRSGAASKWHDMGFSMIPAPSSLSLDVGLVEDTSGGMSVDPAIDGSEKGRIVHLTCDLDGREHTITLESLLTGIVIAYDTPTRDGTRYVYRVR